ncbi:MAG: EscU/YscU/HrcU family type III secretion system export apparatus switch protein [Fuerstiella sp.]|nr:EscU/YscU/HrcU family type III secretion system export apparatus switch protein [Fuerstiella sp.]
MAEQENEGTEAPTPRRREEARKDGQVVASPDISSAAAVLAGCLFMLWSGAALGQRFLSGFKVWLIDAPVPEWTNLHTQLGARWLSLQIAGACGGLVLILFLVSLFVGFSQAGFMISWKPMELDLQKISPMKGWKRLFSMESAIKGVLGISKVVLLLLLSCSILWFRRAELSAANFATIGGLFSFGWNIGLTICLTLAFLSFSLAAVDYISRWIQHEKKLKMSHQEIKQEQKDELGDPTVRAAVRRKQREALKNQSVAAVPDATVILTNPTHFAVALQYVPGKMTAPKLVAKGAGSFAANIVKIARTNRIPVIQRPPLTRAIFRSVNVGQQIPAEFFRAVAEILGQIYRVKGQRIRS